MAENETQNEETLLDLDDPSLQEAQNYDPQADADAFVPPPERDENGNVITYTVKLRLGENKFKKKEAYFKNDKQGRPMGILMVDSEIADSTSIFDGARLGSEWFNTFVNKRTSASSYTNIARLLGSPLPPGLGVKAQSELLENLIASEPLIGARIQWSGYCRGCEEEKTFLEGEKKWPEKVDSDGNTVGHIPLIECKDCGTDVTPKIKVKNFVKLGS